MALMGINSITSILKRSNESNFLELRVNEFIAQMKKSLKIAIVLSFILVVAVTFGLILFKKVKFNAHKLSF